MPIFWKGLTDLLVALFQLIDDFEATSNSANLLAWFISQKSLLLLAPLFFLVIIIGFFSSFLQIGWLVTAQPLIPDMSKLDPIKGMGRFISKKSLVELLKSLTKVALIAWIAYSTILDNFGEALLLVDTSIAVTIGYMARIAVLILAKVCAVLILIAFIDFMFVRWEMEQKMKMTKQELKEEFKEMEGDPHIKAQIRSIQQEMARKRMMAEVPTADVVVTNPTHISVALRYSSAEMDAPVVVAKGSDYIAMKIREIAREHDIPIIENPPVARMLHKLDLGAAIPEEMFRAVAEILAHVYSLKGQHR
jgi:flagellar biosynthetic protein FlhB